MNITKRVEAFEKRGYRKQSTGGRSLTKEMAPVDQYGDSINGDHLTAIVHKESPSAELWLVMGKPAETFAVTIRSGIIMMDTDDYLKYIEQEEAKLVAIHQKLRATAAVPITQEQINQMANMVLQNRFLLPRFTAEEVRSTIKSALKKPEEITTILFTDQTTDPIEMEIKIKIRMGST